MNKLYLLALALLLSGTSFGNTYYVNVNAKGLRLGNSWTDAFTFLQSAFYKAKSGDTIKVAAGVYIPDTTGYQGSSFYLIRGLTLLGGYPATGNPNDSQRDFVNNPTVLSGQLKGAISNIIVKAYGVDTTTLCDGFFIRNAGNTAMDISNTSKLIVRNVVFENSYTGPVNINQSEAKFYNCVFSNNTSYSSPTFYNAAGSTAVLYNCVFSNNYTDYVFANYNSSLTVVNTTVANNYDKVLTGVNGGSAVFKNCILWNNRHSFTRYYGSDGAGELIVSGQSLTVSNCVTDVYYDGSNNTVLTASDPLFVNIHSPAGPDNKFFTADDGLQLTAPCSPGLNSGVNSAVNGITTDILGNPRIYNNGIVDMGAYERQTEQGAHFTTVYVNASTANTGNNDGGSWQNAFHTLQEALMYCADTVKVAAGTYFPVNSGNDSVLFITKKRVLLGGYPSSGSPLDADRNPAANRTILTDNFTGGSLRGTTMKVFRADSTSRIDGFEFNVPTSPSGTNLGVPMYVVTGSKIRITNCVFKNNFTSNAGAMCIADSASPVIENCQFINNHAPTGQSIICRGGSSPLISRCLFSSIIPPGNTDFSDIENCLSFTSSSGTIDSCRFLSNSDNFQCTAIQSSASSLIINKCFFTAAAGGGLDRYIMSNSNGSNHTINNCVFSKPGIFGSVSAIFNDNSNPVFTYCVFDSSKLNIRNVNYSAPVFNNCLSLYGTFMSNSRSQPVINNSTIFDATSTGYKATITNGDSSVVRANNSIFAGVRLNTGELDFKDTKPSIDTVILTNCITRNYGRNGVNGNIVNANPRFYQMWDVYGPDGKLFTADDGLQLSKCSPAINKGNNALTKNQTDISSKPRIANGTVDIGAYEMQESNISSGSYYVNANATGNNTGTSWQNAYRNLQTAVCNACADTIRVAAGTYYPATTGRRDSAFLIDRKLTLLGGYPAFGNPGDDLRKPAEQETILSGEIGSKNEIRDNSQLVMMIFGTADTTVVDGFTIRDSYSKEGITNGMLGGGGMLLYYANAIVRNCLFTNNSSVYTCGGGLTAKQNSNIALTHNIFTNNNGGNSGGAILAAGNINMSDCVVENNNAWAAGGAALAGLIDVHDCIFYNNYTLATNATGSGGGLDVTSAQGKLNNCIFMKNNAGGVGSTGGGVLFRDGDLGIRSYNNIFSGNTIAGTANVATADGNHSEYNVNGNNLYQSPPDRLFKNFSGFSASFVDSLHPKGPDGKWFTADDGIQLAPYSRLINKGTTKTVDGTLLDDVLFDILGNQRIVSDTVDIGPYEYQNTAIANAGRDTVVCYGDSIVLGVKGNPAHTYSWTSNPAGFSSSLQMPKVKPDVATAYYLAVSNGTVTAYDTVKVSFANTLAPSVSIFADTNRVCAGSIATLHAMSSNGGDKASYQWFIDGVDAYVDSAAINTAAIKDGSIVTVVLKSSLSCASPLKDTSAGFKMTVLPMHTPTVTIIASDTSACNGAKVTFTPIITYGGAKPVYNWFRSGVRESYDSIFTTNNILTNDQIVLDLYSSDVCITKKLVESQPIKMTIIQNVTPAVSINASDTSVCRGTIVTFRPTITNGGSNPVYNWFRSGVKESTDNTFSSSTLSNGDDISLVLYSSITCITQPSVESQHIKMTVNESVTPSVSITAPVSEACPAYQFVFNANQTNGGRVPGYQWLWNNKYAGSNMPSYTNSSMRDGDSVAVILTSDLKCATSATAKGKAVIVKVLPQIVPAVTISGHNVVAQGENASLFANVVNGGTSTLYQWQDSTATHGWQDIANANFNNLNYTPERTGDKVRCLIVSSASGCISNPTALSNAVSLVVGLESSDGLVTYPNPVTNVVHIPNLNLADNWQTVEIVNIGDGQRVIIQNIANQTNVDINVSQLPRGVYMVVLRAANGNKKVGRFVKI
jgi:hypothetical protein